ncbi:MAG: extracellular solute-binding protein [Clostridia bacterium]|nr:extracellular solute-binding protein [Clostridia bacterium]MBO5440323.1 extracellular solute-binding protein [Clostridia bacterium]
MKKTRNIYTALVFIFLYMPIFVLILYSFNSSNSTSTFEGFSLKWYRELFSDSATLDALKNTLILAILSALISTVIGTMAAYGINKMQNKYVKGSVMSVTKIPMMNPEIVTGISMMLLFVFVGVMLGGKSSLGFGTVLIAHVTFNLPYVILSVMPKFKQMDKSLPEAALDLGCTPIQSFFKVELPQILPGIISGLIMAFTLSLDDFVISYFTIGSGFETLPIRIYSMTKKRVTPDMYALSTLIFVSILILLLVSNLVSDKNKEKMSKQAKKITKIVLSSVFAVIAVITLIVFIASAGKETVTVNVYNWGEYISDGSEDTYNTNLEFEKYYEEKLKAQGKDVDVRVNYTTYASNEDLYAKLKSGAGGYDIIIPSDYMIERLKADGLIQQLDLSKIPNFDNIEEQFRNPFYDKDPNEKYTVMYTYGVIGIIYNKDKLAPADLEKIENGEAGWELLWDEKYKGQILQFNNARDAFGTAMYALGIDVNNATDEDWQNAYNKLLMQKPLVQSYVMDEIYNKMESGEATLAAYYAGDCLSMIANNESLGFFYPKNENGEYVTNIFADAMCIPKDAQNVEHAYEYINFMLSPEAARANAEYIYYASPNSVVINNEDYIDYLGEDYDLIYDPDFNNLITANGEEITYIEYMFNTYAYRDLSDESRAKLNSLWEGLKVDSASFGSGIYIICAVILVLLIGFIVYKYIERRRHRRLYWNNAAQPKVVVSRNDFNSTAMYDAVKAELEATKENEKK